jgi:uncharacterized membrane protein
MDVLILGLVLFFLVHLIPARPSLREALVARLGAGGYKIAFSLFSLVAFALIVQGKGGAHYVELWQPPAWTRHVPLALMPIAFITLVAAYLPCNLRRILKHPMLVAIKLWALSHLVANGDLASVVLFGSFLAWAVLDRISVKRRGVTVDQRRHALWRDLAAVVAGLAAYAVVVMNHQHLFGVPAVLRAAG